MLKSVLLDRMLTEERIQQDIFLFANNTFCRSTLPNPGIIFHVPNQMQHKLTGIGVKAGVSDLIFIFMSKCLFIEIKSSNGKQSSKQAVFQKRIESNGFKYYIMYSKQDFINMIKIEFPTLNYI